MIPFALANLFASRNDPLRKPEEAIPALLAATTNPPGKGSKTPSVVSPGALSLTAGPGALSSAMGNPQPQAPAKKKQVQAALSPLQQVEEVSSPVVQAFADAAQGQGPEMAPGALDLSQYEAPAQPADPSVGPSQEPQPALNLAGYEQGILSKVGDFLGPNFLGRLGDGLLVAGSQDPAKALSMLNEQKAAQEEAQPRRVAATRPKVTPLGDGVFSLVQFPDGTQRMVKNSEIAAYHDDQRGQKHQQDLELARVRAEGKQKEQQALSNAKAAAEARPQLNQLRETINTMEQALKVVDQQGTTEQLLALPGVSTFAEFFGAEGAAGNKLLQQLKVDDALRNTAQTKGAISNEEMRLFLSSAPHPAADRQKVWKPWIENKISVFKRLEKTLEGETARGEPPAAPLGAAVDVQSQAEASWGSYEPGRYDYRINPETGKLQRKLKESEGGAQGASTGGLPRVSSDADYAQLPAGARYVSPDGKVRQKGGMVVPGLSERASKYFQ